MDLRGEGGFPPGMRANAPRTWANSSTAQKAVLTKKSASDGRAARPMAYSRTS